MREGVRLRGAGLLTRAGLRIDDGQPSLRTLVRAITAVPVAEARFARTSGESTPAEVVDLVVEVGLPTHPKLFEWIASSWDAAAPSRNGAVLTCDASYIVRREREFRGAVVSETAFPALDAATTTPLSLAVRLVPTRTAPDKDASQPLALGPGPIGQVGTTAANFRVHVDGLDTSGISRVEPFAIRRPIERSVGLRGEPELRVGPVGFPNLRLHLSAMTAPGWIAWNEDFVIKGNNGPASQKGGSIDLMALDAKTVLARLELAGLGIVRLIAPTKEAEASEAIARYEADLSCRQMKLLTGS